MKKKSKYLYFIKILLAICVVFFINTPVLADDNISPQKVRVGFFEFDGYHEINENGVRSGYGYDFLQMLGGYANFSYEYVGYNNSWDDMLQMLENNEIDMVTFARYTEDRKDIFDYSEHPMGYTAVILTTTTDQTKIKAGDYSTYQNIKIGMLAGSTQQAQMDAYSKQHKFNYQPIYYDTLPELKLALQETKEVDAIATNSIRTIENECVLDSFDETPFYVIVRKGDTKLLNQIDYAMNMLDTYNPTWKIRLSESYYSIMPTSQTLNMEQKAYLQDLKTSGKKLRVLINPDLKPYSYFEKSRAKGILVDYFNSICELYDLKVTYLPVENVDEYYKIVVQQSADLILAPNIGFYEADKDGYNLTRSFMNAPVSIVTRKGMNSIESVGKIAVISGVTSILNAALSNFQDNSLDYYDTMDACVEAVKMGQVDGALLYSYSAIEYLNEDWNNELNVLDVINNSIMFSIAVPQKADPNLYVLLSTGINSIDDTQIQWIVLQNTLATQKKSEPLLLYIYHNPLLLLILCGLILFIIIYLQLNHSQKIKMEQITKRKQAEFEAEHDVLTGLFNRKAYERIAEQMTTEKTPIGYMLLDIDYFKSINDKYGHDTGDRLLEKVADLFEIFLREEDYAFRFGGDEFVILFHNTTDSNIDFITQKVQTLSTQLQNAEKDIPGVHFSAGVCFSAEGINRDVYRKADDALYHTKKNGRSGCTMVDINGNILFESHNENIDV